MADQKRWFKLWCSAPSDDDLLALPLELRWAWAVLGCYTKEHGTRGRVKITPSNVVLAAQMGVSVIALHDTISMLPHVQIEEGKSDNGSFTVTWDNWHKYQEDSTIAQRVARLRSKRRGEENKTRRDKELPPIAPHEGALNGLDPAHHILDWLNRKAGRNYRPSPVNLTFIRQRLKDGIHDWQLKAIVSRKCREWAGTDQAKYLRPATLFNKTKCEQYLGELPKEIPHDHD